MENCKYLERTKLNEIWDTWVPVKYIYISDTFDLVMFKVIWGYLVHLQISGNTILETLFLPHL